MFVVTLELCRAGVRNNGSHPSVPADWPIEELHRFAQGDSRTHQAMILVLDLLGRRPELWHPVPDVAEALHVPLEEIIGALGGLNPRADNRADNPAKTSRSCSARNRHDAGTPSAAAYPLTDSGRST